MNRMTKLERVMLFALATLVCLLLTACGKATVVTVVPPEPMIVACEGDLPTEGLPETVLVELSNGQREQRAVVWKVESLPNRLQADTVLAGQVEGGYAVELTLQVTSELPQLSADDLSSGGEAEAIERRLQQDLRVQSVNWSHNRQLVAFILNDETLCLWQIDKAYAQPLNGIAGAFCSSITWSYNDHYLLLDTGTSPARYCIIVDAVLREEVRTLVTAGHGIWAPHRNALLVGLFNEEMELNWRAPEYGSDLAVYDLDTRQLSVLLRSSQEYEFRPVAWDVPSHAIYDKFYFHQETNERDLTFAIEQITANPQVPSLPKDQVANRANLDQLLQQAGLREITWSPDGLTVAFLASNDLYLWHLPQTAPVRVESLGVARYLHHLFWSPSSKFLAVHDGFGNDVQLNVLQPGDNRLVNELAVYTQAYWAPGADQLLLAVRSEVSPTIDFTIDYLTDLALYDAETGATRLLLAADGEHSYRPCGWSRSGEALYETISGRHINPEQAIRINP